MHVYLITCLANGKIYVGQTSKQNLNRYFRQKLSDATTRSNPRGIPLYHAIRKYGHAAFIVESLCRPKTKNKMDELEKKFIIVLNARDRNIGYNVTAGGEGALGVKKSAAFRLAVSQRMKGKRYALGAKRSEEQKEGMRKRMIGNTFNVGRKPTSPKHIAALKASSFANKTKEEFAVISQKAYEARKKVGWIVTEEQKHKISAATKGKKKTIETKNRMRESFVARTTHEERCAMSAAANKARSEKLSPEERSRLAKIGSDAALAKMGPYVPKPEPTGKTCKTCSQTKIIELFPWTWVSSVRQPELGRRSYRTECKDCTNIAKRERRALAKERELLGAA